MILDGSHKKWCIATLLLLLLASGAYVVYARTALGGPRGGSVPGMLYGIAGSALMVYAGLISVRKKFPTWRIGSAQTWLRGHIWLGLLSVPLILFHAGFRWGGLLEQVLLLVMAAIVVSGLVGLAWQQLVPRQMTARVPLETFYAQLPHECRLLQVEADVAVAAVCGLLPVDPDKDVATDPRLKALGVTSRNRHQPLFAVVYQTTGAENGRAPVAEPAHPAPKAHASAAVAAPSEVKPEVEDKPKKPLSAADKIAAMRAAKPTAPKAPASTTESPEPSNATEGDAPKAKMSAAEKIAMMRSIKRTTPKPEEPSVASEPANNATAEEAPKAKMTAAEKIALMRSSKKPPAAAASAAEKVEPTEAPAAAEPKKPLSAAEKIALMRGSKGAKPMAATAETGDPPPAAPTDAVAPAKLSAAEKIALMRGSKGAKPTAATAGTGGPSPAAPTDATAPAKLSAADKIALMRGKAKAPPADEAAAAVAKAPEPEPKQAVAGVATKTPAEKKPPDAQTQQRAREELMTFYIDIVRPFLDHSSQARGGLASEVDAGGIFAAVGAGLPEELRPTLDRLLSLCDKRRQLSVQERIHGWLHSWLFLHVPLSLALLGLGIVHAIVSLYY